MKRLLQNSVWRYRDLRLAGPAQALTFLAGEIVVVSLLLQAFGAGWGSSGTAAVLVAAALPLALGAVVAGPVVDRFPSRRLAVGAACWQSVVCLGMAGSQAGGLDGRLLLPGLLLLQLGQAVAGPTWAALLPSLVPVRELPAAVGRVQALVMLLGVLGPVVAGAAVSVGGVGLALSCAAVGFAAVGVLAARVRTQRPGTRATGAPAPGGLDGYRFLRTEPVLSVLVAGFVAFVLAVEVTGVVLVFLVRGELGASELVYGVLGGVVAVGLVTGNLVAARIEVGHRMVRATVVGAMGMSLALVAVGLAPGVVLVGVGLLALGLFNGMLNTGASTTLAVRVPVEQRGRVLAAVTGGLRTASVLGLVAGGAVGILLDSRTVVVGSGVLGLAVAAWLVRRLWREDASVRERGQRVVTSAQAPVGGPEPARTAR